MRMQLPARWSVAPLVAALLAAALAIVTQAASDEPPVRVKNGSLELEQVGPYKKQWKVKNNKWVIDDAELARHRYGVSIALNGTGNAHPCTTYLAIGDKVTLTFSDTKHKATLSVTLAKEQNEDFTSIATQDDLGTGFFSKHVLKLKKDGYISKIELDGTTMCDFTSGDQLEEILITNVP